tara:strand:+ start:11734 stop:12345 length:612 start_codon:yes stop_codon:yes gene_type:complete
MALVSASTLREYLPEIAGNTAIDGELNSLISRVEKGIANFLGFPYNESLLSPTLESTTYTFYVDAPIHSDVYTLQLPISPVTSITSIHADGNREYGSDTLVDSSTYDLDQKYGRVILKPQSVTRYFVSSYRGNKVVCTAGFATAPSDLEHAICILASMAQRNKTNQGKESLTSRNGSIKLTPKNMPLEVKEYLWPYRSPTAIL